MRNSVRIFWKYYWYSIGAIFLIVVLAALGVFGKMPSLRELENPTIIQASEVYAADGTLMGRYFLPTSDRSNVKFDDISPFITKALIATEDKNFYNHSGIDVDGTFRAFVFLGTRGGGSSITQQLAKALLEQGSSNVFLRLFEKIKEWIIAIKLERNFTKNEILALYLNVVGYSDNVFGIRNASLTFFNKEPDRVTLPEAAMLVAMIKGPTLYNPRTNPINSKNRRDYVIKRMEEMNFVTEDEFKKNRSLPIDLSHYNRIDHNSGYAPYFREILKEQVKKILKNLHKPNSSDNYDIYTDGLKIYTTIDPQMQEYAEAAVAKQMPNLQRNLNAMWYVKNGSIWKDRENVLDQLMRQSDRWRNLSADKLSDIEIKNTFYKKVPMTVFAWNNRRQIDTVMTPLDSIKYCRQTVQSGFLVVDPLSGDVKAWVGGVNFKTFKYDHVNLNTKRQVGSSIKPLLYTQAIAERGFMPNSIVLDQQQSFGGGRLVPATSKSCTGREMTMSSALTWSRNCATAYIMKNVGANNFSQFLSKFNIPTKIEPFPSICLGTCDLSLFEMVWMYTIFAGHGIATEPHFITRIEDRNGNVIMRGDVNINRSEIISDVTAYTMARMMEGPVTLGTAAGLMYRLGAAEMGGKTGTTQDNTDAWFMGYTPQLLAGAWVGCDDQFIRNEGAGGFGGAAARPIWEDFFRNVFANSALGIDRNAKFIPPPTMKEIISSDVLNDIDLKTPIAEGDDVGTGTAQDYAPSNYNTSDNSGDNNDYTPYQYRKKDSTIPKSQNNSPTTKQKDSATIDKKKSGFFKRLFQKKDGN